MREAELFDPPWKPRGFDEAALTSEEAKILGYLKFHVGAARAIKIELLSRTVGIPDRETRQILKHLTERHGLAIASSVQPPYGVYLVETPEELNDYCDQLKGRALSALHRMAVLRKRHLGELLGQLRIEAEGPPAAARAGEIPPEEPEAA